MFESTPPPEGTSDEGGITTFQPSDAGQDEATSAAPSNDASRDANETTDEDASVSSQVENDPRDASLTSVGSQGGNGEDGISMADSSSTEVRSGLDASTGEANSVTSGSGAAADASTEPTTDTSSEPTTDTFSEFNGIAELDAPCPNTGLRACAGAAQDQLLICSGGDWRPNGTCASGENCDRITGLCETVVDGCRDLQPGAVFCRDDLTVTCGADLTSVTELMCEGRCVSTADAAVCALPACSDGKTQSGEECDDGNRENNDACTNDCLLPVCGDQFLSPEEQCDDGSLWSGDGCSRTCTKERIAAGGAHACAILMNGSVKCWGLNTSGQLGAGDTFSRGTGDATDPGMGADLEPIELGTGRFAVAITAGEAHTCALLDNGTVKCWGENEHGQLGQGSTTDRGTAAGDMGDNLPSVELGTGKLAIAVSAGAQQTCALLNDGSVKCWGRNLSGGLGQGDSLDRGTGLPDDPGMGDDLAPIALGDGASVVAITSGTDFVCVLLNSGAVKCWGANKYGQLGQGNDIARGGGGSEDPGMGDNLLPIRLGEGLSAVSIAAGDRHACALLVDGGVKCWGSASVGQLGQGNTQSRGAGSGTDPGMGDNLRSVDLGTGKQAFAIVAGLQTTCALLNDQTAKCWGDNSEGQLGQGNDISRGGGSESDTGMGDDLQPINLGGNVHPVELAAGASFECAVMSDNSVKCWGNNAFGQLGIGDTDDRGTRAEDMGTALAAVDLE